MCHLNIASLSSTRCDENRFQQPPLPRQCHTHKGISTYLDGRIFTDDFWKFCFQRQEVYVRGCRDNVLSSSLDQYTLGSILSAALQMKEGQFLRAMKSGVGHASRMPFKEYVDGHSLILNTADRFHPALAQLCRELADKYFFHVFCVFYLTPPHAWARRPHNDDQDVIIMQLWGSKQWRLFESSAKLIYSEEMVGKREPISGNPKVVRELTLTAGDLLYIPRGMVHDARATRDPSLHVTITVPTFDLNYGVSLTEWLRDLLPSLPVGTPEDSLLRSAVTRVSPDDGCGDSDLQQAGQALLKLVTKDDVRKWVLQKAVVHNHRQVVETCKCLQEASAHTQLHRKSLIKALPGVTVDVDSNGQCILRHGTQVLELAATDFRAELLKGLFEKSDGICLQDIAADDPFEALCLVMILAQQGFIEVYAPHVGVQSGLESLASVVQQIKDTILSIRTG